MTRSCSNGNGASNPNGPGNPYSWKRGYEAPEPYRSSWDHVLGDPFYR